MSADPRAELQRLYDEWFLVTFPHAEWFAVEQQFDAWDTYPEVLDVEAAEKLRHDIGAADLHLYDSYIGGNVSYVLSGSRSGADLLADAVPDARLTRYLELCAAEAPDEQTRTSVDACRAYVDELNRMLDWPSGTRAVGPRAARISAQRAPTPPGARSSQRRSATVPARNGSRACGRTRGPRRRRPGRRRRRCAARAGRRQPSPPGCRRRSRA